MSEHTAEPWFWKREDWRGDPSPHHIYISGATHEDYDDDDDEEPVDEDSPPMLVSTGIAIVHGNATSQGVTEANARRIVACVNSLVGIPTEAIEGGVVGAMRDAIEGLAGVIEAQSKLLAAYRVGGRPPGKVLDFLRGRERIVSDAEDVLARLKGA